MKTTVWILGDQLSPHNSALADLPPAECVVLFIESVGRARKLPYHKQKLTFVWSAMRHFAAELRELGYTVDYHETQPAFGPALQTHLEKYRPQELRLMKSAEHGGSERLAQLVEQHGVSVEITPNTMLLSDSAKFQKWAKGKKSLRMETFYRQMRRQTGLLMDDSEPAGGQWNYDHDNRETPPPDHRFPPIPTYPRDDITETVMAFVADEFPDNFGSLDEFWLPVTRADAEAFFEDFLDNRLDLFGPYEDAVVAGERALYHSLLSSLLNVGLLEPLALCRAAEERYR